MNDMVRVRQQIEAGESVSNADARYLLSELENRSKRAHEAEQEALRRELKLTEARKRIAILEKYGVT